MIVVIGAIEARASEEDSARVTPAGLASGVALSAAATGSRVEVVTRLGEDAVGDALLLAFAAARVGHVATLRDAAHATPLHANDDDAIDPDAPDEAPAARPTVDGAPAERPTLEAADVALALRYLSEYRVIVVVHPTEEGIVREVAVAAEWAGAHLVVLTEAEAPPTTSLASGSVLLTADAQADGVAVLVGRYAAAVDSGEEPAAAFRATLGAAG